MRHGGFELVDENRYSKINLGDVIIEKRSTSENPKAIAARSGLVSFLAGLSIFLLIVNGDIVIVSDSWLVKYFLEILLVLGIPTIFFLILFSLEYFLATKYQYVEINKNFWYLKVTIVKGTRKISRTVSLDRAQIMIDYPYLRIIIKEFGEREEFRISIDSNDFKRLLEVIPKPRNVIYEKPILNVNEKVEQLLAGNRVYMRLSGFPFPLAKILQLGMDLTAFFTLIYLVYLAIMQVNVKVLLLTVPTLIVLTYLFIKHLKYIFGSMRDVYSILELKDSKLSIVKIAGLKYEIEVSDIDEVYLIKKPKRHIIMVYGKNRDPLNIDIDPRLGEELYSILKEIKQKHWNYQNESFQNSMFPKIESK